MEKMIRGFFLKSRPPLCFDVMEVEPFFSSTKKLSSSTPFCTRQSDAEGLRLLSILE